MSDLQEQVKDVLDKLVGSGVERGIQVAAYIDGVQVVDAVAGVADARTGPSSDTRDGVLRYAIGNGAMATVVHQ